MIGNPIPLALFLALLSLPHLLLLNLPCTMQKASNNKPRTALIYETSPGPIPTHHNILHHIKFLNELQPLTVHNATVGDPIQQVLFLLFLFLTMDSILPK